MRFNLYKPCDDCPFLKKGGIRLTDGRVRDIAAAMLDSQGSTFACHKTTVDAPDDDEGAGGLVATAKSKHCAGALIFGEKQGKVNQMVRIMERIGEYRRAKFMSDEKVVASVFDSLAQMLKVNREAFGGGVKKKRRRKA